MNWLPDGAREVNGEKVEQIAHDAVHMGYEDAIRLAHRVLERFPEVRKRHMFIAGGAALSSALLIGAAVAITRRVRAGQNPADAAEDVTAEELDGVHLLERRRRATGGDAGAGGTSGERKRPDTTSTGSA